MNRLLALLVAAVGIALYLRTRRPPALQEYAPAEELRTKLAESRATDDAAATPPEPSLESDLADRRRDVHERARGAIDDLS